MAYTRTRGYESTLVKDQTSLDIRKYPLFLMIKCEYVHACSVNIDTNRIGKHFVMSYYTWNNIPYMDSR